MNLYYRLDGHTPVPCEPSALSKAYSKENRIVAQTNIDKETMISTVFLMFDHNWRDDGPPILFETMIFGGPLDQSQWRYCTWDEAEDGHLLAVAAALMSS